MGFFSFHSLARAIIRRPLASARVVRLSSDVIRSAVTYRNVRLIGVHVYGRSASSRRLRESPRTLCSAFHFSKQNPGLTNINNSSKQHKHEMISYAWLPQLGSYDLPHFHFCRKLNAFPLSVGQQDSCPGGLLLVPVLTTRCNNNG